MTRTAGALFFVGLGLLFFYSFGSQSFTSETNVSFDSKTSNLNQNIQENFGKLPINFEINRGQMEKSVRFLSRGKGYTLFLTDAEAVLSLEREADSAVLRMKTSGAKPPAKIEGINEQVKKSNYFIGNDSDKWRKDIPNFAKVRYEEIYSGVDLVYYGNGQQLEYDFVVAPNADFRQIALEFEGADNLKIDAAGDLVLQIGGAEVRQQKPVIYQESETGKNFIAGNYKVSGANKIGFEVADYDRSKPLVIDPILVFSTYFGGFESDIGEAIAIDSEKNVYFTGRSGSTDYPVVNPYQAAPRSFSDIIVTKLNAAGNQVLFSTYIGASTGGYGSGIDVDAQGNVYVTGSTVGFNNTNDFPTTPNAFDRTFNGTDDVVFFKLSPTGNNLLYSTFFGGDNSDSGLEVKVNRATNEIFIGGNGYLAGTGSPQVPFPTTANAYRQTCGAALSCGFVAKFNGADMSLVYSTFITEGSASDIAIDAASNVYITGQSIGNLQTTPGAPQPNCNGCGLNRFDAYIAKLNPQGNALVYATYLGGNLTDRGNSIAIDAAGNAYVTGKAEGGTIPFPTTPGAYRTDGVGHFATKLNAAGTAFVYSTMLGGTLNSEGFGIAVDPQGRAHLTGESNSVPLVKPFQGTGYASARHPFIVTVNETGSDLLFSTLFGAPGAGNEIVVDNVGDIYLTGKTYGELPVANPIQPENRRYWQNDVFISKISFRSNRQLKFDFDGDAKANITIFRPFNRTWYVFYGNDLFTPYAAVQFGLATDRLVPADYDGDGREDIAVFREGDWYILLRSLAPDRELRTIDFGQAGDIPVAGDYDGDGKDDVAVFRPSDGTWYLLQSRAGFAAAQFGLNGDKPLPGDYDGDGRDDIAVYRGGTWYILRSGDGGFTAFQFGLATDRPVPADYDGDGKTDVAVYRDGIWYIQQSRDGFAAPKFGVASDKPVAADYDRDGRADLAVYRNDTWYILRSQQGLLVEQFGASGDVPVAFANQP